jgi:putative FmdB family regulatory protein
MPIYAYKCGSCGHAKDVLQKISDAPQTLCPACGKESWSKQLSAPGFQLKGTGWYATDFKNGGTSAPAVASDAEKPAPSADNATAAGGDAKPSENNTTPSDSSSTSVSTGSSTTSSAPSSVSAASSSSSSGSGCGASCACH